MVSWKMSFDLNIIVDQILLLALQNKKTLCEDADLFIEEEKNQLDSPPRKIT